MVRANPSTNRVRTASCIAVLISALILYTLSTGFTFSRVLIECYLVANWLSSHVIFEVFSTHCSPINSEPF